MSPKSPLRLVVPGAGGTPLQSPSVGPSAAQTPWTPFSARPGTPPAAALLPLPTYSTQEDLELQVSPLSSSISMMAAADGWLECRLSHSQHT